MKVLLIGESCNDVFVDGTCCRLSPEVPVPVLKRGESRAVAGMAGNVLANLHSLAPDIAVTSVLAHCGTKIRFLDSVTGHNFLRLDDECVSEFPIADLDRAIQEKPDALVVSDYGKGQTPLRSAARMAREGVPVFVDTKSLLGPWSEGCFVKINQHEFAHQLANGVKPWEHCKKLIVTQGGKGMALFDGGAEPVLHVPAVPIEVRDGAGCGDTVLAALVVRYLENGGNMAGAMEWAAKAGAAAVTRRGVVAVKREDFE